MQPKNQPTAEEFEKYLQMDAPLDYAVLARDTTKRLREFHAKRLPLDICMFAKQKKDDGILTLESECVQAAIMPIGRALRLIQAEQILPRGILTLIDDPKKREEMREIHRTVFIFHSTLNEPPVNPTPLTVSTDEFNTALDRRGRLFTQEEYEALVHRIPDIKDLHSISATAMEIIKSSIDLANSRCSVCNGRLAVACRLCTEPRLFCSTDCRVQGAHTTECEEIRSKSLCSVCKNPGAMRCTGCKTDRLFCKRACQGKGEHDEECIKLRAARKAAREQAAQAKQ